MNAIPWKSYNIINENGNEKSSKISHAQYQFYHCQEEVLVLTAGVCLINLTHLFQAALP
jgi:hypothetical protein